MAYLIILVVVSLLLAIIWRSHTNSIIIYAQNDKPDFLQVFFPIDGLYSEKNSVRSAIVGNPVDGISISLPRTPIDYVRIDPANELSDILITKIKLRYLLSTEVLMPNDLVILARPLQMIGKMEATPAGLLIRSTGNDPAFTLQLNSPSNLSQLIKLSIIALLSSLAMFLALRKLAGRELSIVQERAYLIAIPLLISIGVAALFYPGFMSYDTLHALRGARNGVTDSMWPPMVSYVWSVVDFISLNPSAMHFSQVYLLLASIFLIVFFFTKKISYTVIFLLVYLSIPAILGTVAVIWKDVLMAAFFMAGFALTMYLESVINKQKFIILALLITFLIFLGVCSRHNAITAAVPLLFYLAYVVCSRIMRKPLHLWMSLILLGSVLTGVTFTTKVLLDHYILPNFEKMNTSTNAFIQTVRVLDVAGASVCEGRNLFSDMAPNLSISEIRVLYEPKHINLSQGLLSRVGVDSRINEIWLDVAVHHPICFLYNKFQLTKYLIGANAGTPFLITHPYIDKNEYGYELSDSSFRDIAVAYITYASHVPFYKPWFIYLLSIIAFIYLIRTRSMTVGSLCIFLSAGFYFSSFVIFGNAGDARLLFYSTSALLIFIFFTIVEYKKRSL